MQGPGFPITARQVAKIGFRMILPGKIHSGKTLQNPAERL
jgi:hypothetical protein